MGRRIRQGQATAPYLYHPHYVVAVAVRVTSSAHLATEGEHFYLHDALFNVTALVDKCSKAVAERYAYQPYGRATPLTPTYGPQYSPLQLHFANEYRFTGRRVDPGSGLQINRHRYYHSALGRWIIRDPIEYNAAIANLYGYV